MNAAETSGSPAVHAAEVDLSIVTVNYNTRHLLLECLRSLRQGNEGLRTQVIVIDNGSSDGSADAVAAEFPEVALIRNRSNEGFAAPNNQGLRMARGRYAMLLNSDTLVKPRSLETLVRFMDSTANAGACAPKLLNADGSLQPSCRSFPSLWRHFCDMTGLENLFPRSFLGNFETRFSYDRTAEVDQPMGAALLVRREILMEVGLLDERFRIYYNEVDWCRRIIRAGWKIFFVPDAEIIHYGGKTTELTNRSLEQFDEMNRNCLAYYEKQFGRAGLIAYRLMTAAGFSFRLLLWKLVALVKPDPSVVSRLVFARKYFALGVRFWKSAAQS